MPGIQLSPELITRRYLINPEDYVFFEICLVFHFCLVTVVIVFQNILWFLVTACNYAGVMIHLSNQQLGAVVCHCIDYR